MIPLNTTWDTVLMLLIAGGVGLVGGIGAGLLEIRRDPEKAKEYAGTIASSVVLGGIAAVAILYFFSPEETISKTVNGVTTVVREYNLTKLVALALIVGSAGASFLLVLQKKTLDLAEAKEEAAEKEIHAQAVQAKANEALLGVGNQAADIARTSVEEAAPTIREALEKASTRKAAKVSAETVTDVLKDVADQAETAAESSIAPVVQEAQKRILATPEEKDGEGGPVA